MPSLLHNISLFFKGPNGPKCIECDSVLIDNDCPNLDCPAKVEKWLIRWCSPQAANIPAIGIAEAKQLASLRLVLHPGELYELGPGDWNRLNNVPNTQLEEIQQQMDSSKSAGACALIYGLKLPEVNMTIAKKLAETFNSVDGLRTCEPKMIQEVVGVSNIQAKEILSWFHDSVNKKALKMLEQNGFNFSD